MTAASPNFPSFDNLELQIAEQVATIRIARPARRNAIDNSMYRGLVTWLRLLDASDDVRCVVIRGSEAIFTAGSDIREFVGKDVMEREDHFHLIADLLTMPSRMGTPVIAAVKGLALGGGTGLSAACDLVLAEDDAVFGVPEIHIGIWPCTLLPALTRSVGARHAFRMSMLGERLSAKEARDIGLVSRVASRDEFEGALAEMVAVITKASPEIVRVGKRSFQQSLDTEFEKATRFMGQVMALTTGAAEAQSTLQSFISRKAEVRETAS